MRASPVPHYFNVFPTGTIPVPVCIGDLPLSDYIASTDTSTEAVASHLENNPLAPGAILTKDGRLAGVIPRHKMFERLGHRYGVELFLRKPVSEMEQDLGVAIFTLKSHLPINMAVKLALSRGQNNIYDPIIVEFDDGSLRLLDMYVLLLTQSQLSNNLSGIISSLNNIETVLASEKAGVSTLDLILERMNLVVPFHHVRILLYRRDEFAMFNVNDLVSISDESLLGNGVYRIILNLNQPFSLEDVRIVPSWNTSDAPEGTRSWMGIPLSNQSGTVGLLSLSRLTLSPFTNNEKELAQVFARYINSLFIALLHRVEKNRIYQKVI